MLFVAVLFPPRTEQTQPFLKWTNISLKVARLPFPDSTTVVVVLLLLPFQTTIWYFPRAVPTLKIGNPMSFFIMPTNQVNVVWSQESLRDVIVPTPKLC